MRLDITDQMVTVTLSRRNLMTGLHKLDMEGSARSMYAVVPEHATTLVLRFEDDDEHYNHPDRHPSTRGVAGAMHPDTEVFING